MHIRLVPEADLTDTDTTAGAALAAAFGHTGAGAPGSLVAATGSTYTDTAVTDGAVEWTKYADGWHVTKGDTGWVLVAQDAGSVTNHPGMKIYLRRIDGTCHASIFETSASVAGTGLATICTLPVGFRKGETVTTQTGQVMDMTTGGPLNANAYVATTSQIKLYRSPSALHGASLSWSAEPTWPTS